MRKIVMFDSRLGRRLFLRTGRGPELARTGRRARQSGRRGHPRRRRDALRARDVRDVRELLAEARRDIRDRERPARGRQALDGNPRDGRLDQPISQDRVLEDAEGATLEKFRAREHVDPRFVEELKGSPAATSCCSAAARSCRCSRHRLIDEYVLVVSPLLLGGGRPLVADVPRTRSSSCSRRSPSRRATCGCAILPPAKARLDPHLFRREAGRMVAALTRIFGVHNLALAEDVVQDAFCRALEVWKLRGVPDNPSAWLMTTAKQRALDVVRRERTARRSLPSSAASSRRSGRSRRRSRRRSPRRHPRRAAAHDVLVLPSGVAGGGAGRARPEHPVRVRRRRDRERVPHVARAAMEKRITRAQEGARGVRARCSISARRDFAARLRSVQRALYLLFNEGYHGASAEAWCAPSSATRRCG